LVGAKVVRALLAKHTQFRSLHHKFIRTRLRFETEFFSNWSTTKQKAFLRDDGVAAREVKLDCV
jgi:hypothetical protein